MAIWRIFAQRILIPFGVLTAAVFVIRVALQAPRQMFDRSYYDRISERMTLEEVETILRHPAGDYRPWAHEVAKSVRGRGHGPAEGIVTDKCIWIEGWEDNRYFWQRYQWRRDITKKTWWGPEWMIEVWFDQCGKAIYKEFCQVFRPMYED
jgi:hypothetical protein